MSAARAPCPTCEVEDMQSRKLLSTRFPTGYRPVCWSITHRRLARVCGAGWCRRGLRCDLRRNSARGACGSGCAAGEEGWVCEWSQGMLLNCCLAAKLSTGCKPCSVLIHSRAGKCSITEANYTCHPQAEDAAANNHSVSQHEQHNSTLHGFCSVHRPMACGAPCSPATARRRHARRQKPSASQRTAPTGRCCPRTSWPWCVTLQLS